MRDWSRPHEIIISKKEKKMSVLLEILGLTAIIAAGAFVVGVTAFAFADIFDTNRRVRKLLEQQNKKRKKKCKK